MIDWQVLNSAPYDIVVDTEHLPDCVPAWENLLGVSVSWAGLGRGIYLPCRHWVYVPSKELVDLMHPTDHHYIREWLSSRRLSGWNIEHDREWLDACFEIKSNWWLDGRILWYLTDTKQTERGYGLKKAQVTVLGWSESGDKELAEQVEERGGSLSDGLHYLADLAVLGRYAGLDAHSTQEVICKLFTGESWLVDAHDRNRDYAQFLASATRRGVSVDEAQLAKAKYFYVKEVKESTKQIREIAKDEIQEIEFRRREEWFAELISDAGREKRRLDIKRHPTFNPRSPDQRAELLYDVLKLPIPGFTETGKRKTDKHSIAALNHPVAASFVALSKSEKCLQFANMFLQHSDNGTMRFPHDTCATVSERLGGYAPYDLNMPFNSKPIMSAFRVRPGCTGIHMDLVSIEPCLIAGFSGDEAMLKVYRDGLGDIYLDLCLELFPLREAGNYDKATSTLIEQFNHEYRSSESPSSVDKERFKRIRLVAKIIQLAVGYTGTRFTVAKNLTLAGFPTSVDKAGLMVQRYWDRFAKVKTLAAKLTNIVRSRGYIEGFYGRRLFIPEKFAKDALNRFAQHGGHAILRNLVMNIDKAVKRDNIEMWPLLPDVHDATSWEGRVSFETMKTLFQTSIDEENERLSLPVAVRGEIKQFSNFYGVKHEET